MSVEPTLHSISLAQYAVKWNAMPAAELTRMGRKVQLQHDGSEPVLLESLPRPHLGHSRQLRVVNLHRWRHGNPPLYSTATLMPHPLVAAVRWLPRFERHGSWSSTHVTSSTLYTTAPAGRNLIADSRRDSVRARGSLCLAPVLVCHRHTCTAQWQKNSPTSHRRPAARPRDHPSLLCGSDLSPAPARSPRRLLLLGGRRCHHRYGDARLS